MHFFLDVPIALFMALFLTIMGLNANGSGDFGNNVFWGINQGLWIAASYAFMLYSYRVLLPGIFDGRNFWGILCSSSVIVMFFAGFSSTMIHPATRVCYGMCIPCIYVAVPCWLYQTKYGDLFEVRKHKFLYICVSQLVIVWTIGSSSLSETVNTANIFILKPWLTAA